MAVDKEAYKQIMSGLPKHITLVAVSKTKPVEDIQELYNLGQRDFGENYVQELVDKQSKLPADIRWHFIGHLQSNKVKYIAPFVHLVHGVDSPKLLQEINKQAIKNKRVIECLLQVHIAQEETKFGFDKDELQLLIAQINMNTSQWDGICVKGLMGMASLTDNMKQVRNEFCSLKEIFDNYSSQPISNCQWENLSMGMSSDYTIAIEEGSTMVRIGSLVFGARNS